MDTAFPTAPPAPAREELRALLALTGPIAVLQLAHQLVSAVDTAVVGRLGEVPLSGVGLGGTLFFAVLVIGLGIVLGLDPLIAQALGAAERTETRTLLWQGTWLSMGLTIPLTAIIAVVIEVLPHSGIDPATASATGEYLWARAPAIAPWLMAIANRSYLQALGTTRPLLVAAVVANVVNAPLSWLLVFGDAGLPTSWPALGIPALGVAGAGWASSAASLSVLVVTIFAVRAAGSEAPGEPSPRRWPDPVRLRRALRVGAPVGGQLLAEVGGFAAVTFLVGLLGARALAAHHVALTLASTSFQVTLALGAAAAVRVGRAVGRGDVAATDLAGRVAIGTGAAFMVFTGAVLLLFPAPLARLLTDEVPVLTAAIPLLGVAAAFQIGDGVQVVAAGALRGAGDTRATMLANVGGHYLLGLPLGATLCFGLDLGAAGLWWGLSAALWAVAALLTIRFVRIAREPIVRS